MDEGNLWFCETSCERMYHEMAHLFAVTNVNGNREVAILANEPSIASRRGSLLTVPNSSDLLFTFTLQ